MNNQKKFFQNYYQYLQGIELCINNKLTLPALSLIYSGMDTLAWITYGDIGVKKRFTLWVEKYMYPNKKLNPDPIDLYAARCAILHTLTPESDLSKNNKAKIIAYSWGNANNSALAKSIETLEYSSEMTSIHIDDLFESFKLGIAHFIETKITDEECLKRISIHYTHMGSTTIETFNNISQ